MTSQRRDSGQAALDGFAWQALLALTDGLHNTARWTEFTIEPSEASGVLEKVDIRWKTAGSPILHDQVKRRSRPVGQGEIARWVAELASDEPGLRTRLLIVGHPTAKVMPRQTVGSVDVEFRSDNGDVVLDAIALRIAGFVDCAYASATVPRTRSAAHRLAAILLFESRHGKTWTRSALRDLILDLLRPGPESKVSAHEPPRVAVVVRTLMQVSHTGAIEQHVGFFVRNLSSRDRNFAEDPFAIAWEVSEVDEFVGVRATEDGAETEQWIWGSGSRQRYQATVRATGIVAPGATRRLGLLLRHRGWIQRVNQSWHFNQPHFLTAQPYDTEVVIIAPQAGCFDCDAEATTTRTAAWHFESSHDRRMTACWRPDVVRPELRDADDRLAELYLQRANEIATGPDPAIVDDAINSAWVHRNSIIASAVSNT